MMFWIVAAVIVAVSLFVLLRALAVPGGAIEPKADDVAFYRSQQAEIARQLSAGMIDAAEAKAGEAEAARKLLARSRQNLAAPVADARRGRLAQIAVAVALPAMGLPLYLFLGQPQLPSQPIAARTDINRPEKDLMRLVDRLDAHLAEAPDDLRGLEIAFPVYMRIGRYDSALDVAGRLVKLKGPSADRLAALAEAQIFAGQGMVSDEARKTLVGALELDPKHSRARFYSGLAAEQSGEPQVALRIWQELAAGLEDGPEKRAVALQIARLAPKAGPTGEAADAIRSMKPEDQQQAIRGMVDTLEARLKAEGGSVEEWHKLLRALSVMGDKARAIAALETARQKLVGNGEALAALGRIATELGLPEGAQQ
jgi:cytochrome c-type biogenesis protein CcmH